MSLDINPGKAIYYIKDNIKYYGHVIRVDNNTQTYYISLVGKDSVIAVSDGEIEEVPSETPSWAVDQTYSPTSTNPQSGTAVAQAVAQAGGAWSQLCTSTIHYNLLTTQPSDWTSRFAKYYKKVDDFYVCLSAAETFAEDTFYTLDNDMLVGGETDFHFPSGLTELYVRIQLPAETLPSAKNLAPTIKFVTHKTYEPRFGWGEVGVSGWIYSQYAGTYVGYFKKETGLAYEILLSVKIISNLIFTNAAFCRKTSSTIHGNTSIQYRGQLNTNDTSNIIGLSYHNEGSTYGALPEGTLVSVYGR